MANHSPLGSRESGPLSGCSVRFFSFSFSASLPVPRPLTGVEKSSSAAMSSDDQVVTHEDEETIEVAIGAHSFLVNRDSGMVFTIVEDEAEEPAAADGMGASHVHNATCCGALCHMSAK